MNSLLLPLNRTDFPRWILFLVVLSLLGNVYAWLTLGFLPDEAYYWVWSQRPELSYFDHPPLIAWFMWPFTVILGNDLWAVRLPAVISWLIGAIIGFRLAQYIFGGYAGALAVLIWASLPIVQAGFHIVTPDTVLVIFTWSTIWFAWRAGNEGSPKLWMMTGVMAGLAMLAKYPAVLILGAVFFALVTTRQGRQQLRTPWPWLAALVAIVLFLPVVIWNAQHDWISFAFQFTHGVKTKIEESIFELFMIFFVGQLAVAMPWTWFAMAWSGARIRKLMAAGNNENQVDGYSLALLSWNFWLPLIIFGLAGLTSKSAANWPVTAYAGGSVLLAAGLNKWLRRNGQWRKVRISVVAVLFVLPVLLVNLMRFPHWLKLVAGDDFTAERTQLSQGYGWDQLRPELRQIVSQLPEGCKILVDYHGRAGILAWLLEQPQRVVTTEQARYSHYDLWRDEEQGEVCLYFDQYDNQFTSLQKIPQVMNLPEGRFERFKLVTAENPDLSLRWFVFYRPAE